MMDPERADLIDSIKRAIEPRPGVPPDEFAKAVALFYKTLNEELPVNTMLPEERLALLKDLTIAFVGSG